MDNKYNLSWFKDNILNLFHNYEIKYKYFKKGDFGSLNQVEFNSDKIGGNIDFWSFGWLGIFIWDYENDVELLNVLFEPSENEKKEEAIKKFINIIKT